MSFITDQQTLDDLGIFGRAAGAGAGGGAGASIYGLFNRTFTRGGAEVLGEMFRFPPGDAGAINKRSGIIAFFSARPRFPFDTQLFDMAEQYLAETDERTKLSFSRGGISRKLSNLVAEDPGYKFVSSGVAACVAIINGLRDFAASLPGDDEMPYREELTAIVGVLAEPAFAAIPGSDGKMAYTTIADWDVTFRFRHRTSLKKLLRFIYQLDVYISVGRVAAERGFCYPRALASGAVSLELDGLYHPGLADPVPNDFRVTPEGNVIFLTGANMAGKSTFMKSVGIALYLGHMGFPVPAKRMVFSVMDGIYTTINLPDNLGLGISHFYAEVLRVKKVAKELGQGKRLFVIFDELFRGTNVKDAYDATIAITEGFARKRGAMFVISTHIIEAGDVLKERCDNICFSYLPTRMKGNTPVYSYRLEEGITADRHGMIIIGNAGILELLKSAKEL
jgi:DNA mismatch repair protein MutS